MGQLQEQVAGVTGASTGIGKSIAAGEDAVSRPRLTQTFLMS